MKYSFIFLSIIELFFSTLFKSIFISFEERVTIKVKGPGTVQILSQEFTSLPDKICDSEENLIAQRQSQISITEEEKVIIMKWNNRLTNSLVKMFKGLENIIEIDLSKFDSSDIKYMNDMFNGCVILKR